MRYVCQSILNYICGVWLEARHTPLFRFPASNVGVVIRENANFVSGFIKIISIWKIAKMPLRQKVHAPLS